MSEKKCLVVYYSRTGNTRKIGEAIASALSCDIEEVIDKKDRAGVTGFFVGAKDAQLKRSTEIEEPKKNPADYDVVIVGTPVWAWTMCPAIRAWSTRQRDRLPQVAFFLTTGGTGIERTFRHMAELCGKEPLATLALKEKVVKKGGWEEALKMFVGKLR